MQNSGFIFLSFLLVVFCGCKQTPDCKNILIQTEDALNAGEFKKIRILTDSLTDVCPDEKPIIRKADSLLQIAERIAIDFPLTEDEVEIQLKEKTVDFTPEEKNSWEKQNWLECRKINGEKRYFNRAASNLLLLRNFHLQRAASDSIDSRSPEMVSRKKHTQSIIELSDKQFAPVVPVKMTINYSLTVDTDAVPAGQIVRCWLPYPKENHARQRDIKLLRASDKNYIISPDSAIHRTIYMEAAAVKGVPLVFNVSYSYQSSGQYMNRDIEKILSYDKNSESYKKFTSEQLPHICFSENVKKLADSITGSEKDPYEIVRKIYYWFSNNIPWVGALEYSIMPDIPEYVIQNRRGDCGMQTFLFMSMLRYKGIPVRWQSGWKVTPDANNLHDWCEVYFEGPGWILADVSYGLQYSDDRKIREFYISGIDSYRLIINDGISGALYPPKKFLRSEPFDFQRGEVEWDGGNLYFDKWDYDMQITYNNE